MTQTQELGVSSALLIYVHLFAEFADIQRLLIQTSKLLNQCKVLGVLSIGRVVFEIGPVYNDDTS